ncbi:MAG TPA: TIGR03936 family radical SAM-associated protein [Acidimicrobiales bacterium]|nr:TIGR03936 family radical SAM-associated protein [Acidimicrobiales bacterium]
MRVRFRFSKLGKVRWTSHRDVARMWERAFRRAQLPLAWTQGFSPRPRVSFGLALPTGAESVAEYLDVEVAPGAEVDVALLPAKLTPALPAGIDVLAAAVIDDRADSLQHEVTSCSWTVELGAVDAEEVEELVARALAADSLVVSRERKGKVSDEDVRPGILSVVAAGTVLECELAAQPRALRPSELVLALSPTVEVVGMRRTAQWIQRDGARSEPLPLGSDATGAPPAPAMERAS